MVAPAYTYCHGNLSLAATGIPDSHFTKYHGPTNRFFSDNRVNVSSSNGSSAVTDCGVGILEQVHGE